MAIRAIILRKKLNDAKKEIETLRAIDFDSRKAELETREAEIVKAVEEANTEEEQKAVEEAADAFDADKQALDQEVSENETKIADLETSVEEMERELSELENEQVRTVPPIPVDAQPEPEKKTTTKKSGGKRTMFKTRAIRMMNVAEREALIARDDTQEFLKQV